MMDIDGHYEMQRQKHQDMRREAEQYRLARELGFTEAGTLRSIAAKFRLGYPGSYRRKSPAATTRSCAGRDTAVIPTAFKDCV